jgi:hypothetical protein
MKYDIKEFYRGARHVVTVFINGDYSLYKIWLTAKAIDSITADRIIELKNDLAGGTSITVTKVGTRTKLEFIFDATDTQDRTEDVLYYDVVAQLNSDPEVTLIEKSEIELLGDVRTPYDGTDLPEDGERYFPILISEIGAGKVPKVNAEADDVEGILVYTTAAADLLLGNKVDKVTGKGLSTEDYTTTEKNKLSGIEAGAEVNNISDINATDLTDSGATTLHKHSYSNLDNLPDLTLKADLVEGKVPSTQLPSYVDDVVEVANYAALPVTGETGKIYVTLDTNLTYRWSGTAYVEISASLALGETSSTAYRGDRGKTAYDHSQVTHDKTLVGLGNVDNTSDSTKNSATATLTNKTLSAPVITGVTNITDAIFNRAVHSKGDEGGYLLAPSQGVIIPDNNNLSFVSGGMSILVWLKMTDATNFGIISKFESSTNNKEYILRVNTADKLVTQLWDASANAYIGRLYNTVVTSLEGKWIHIAMTYDGSGASTGIRLYINGIRVDDTNDNSGSFVAMENLVRNYFIGAYNENPTANGNIADVKHFNKGLTLSEVLAYYNNGSPTEYAIPFSDKGASNTELITNGTFTGSATGWTLGGGFAYGTDNIDVTASGSMYQAIPSLIVGKKYKVSVTFSNYASGKLDLQTFDGTILHTFPLADGTHTTEFTWVYSSNGTRLYLSSNGAAVYKIDNVSLISIGNVLDLPPQNAGNLGWIDASGNQLSGATSGTPICLTTVTRPPIHREIKKSIANTATTLSGVVPRGYRIASIRLKGSDSLTGIKIGSSSGGEQVVAATTASTTATLATLAATANAGYSETAERTLYVEHATAGQTLDVILELIKVGN